MRSKRAVRSDQSRKTIVKTSPCFNRKSKQNKGLEQHKYLTTLLPSTSNKKYIIRRCTCLMLPMASGNTASSLAGRSHDALYRSAGMLQTMSFKLTIRLTSLSITLLNASKDVNFDTSVTTCIYRIFSLHPCKEGDYREPLCVSTMRFLESFCLKV